MEYAENSPEFLQILRDSARLLHQNRPEAAIELLTPLHTQAPTHPDVTINLGGAYILLRKWDRAVIVLAKAAEAHPNHAMLWLNLGAAHLGRLELAGPKQQERAIHAYERVLQIDPKAPNVHYHLALIYKERGEFVRALGYFQQALEVHPNDQDARRWLERMQRLLAAEQTQNSITIQTQEGALTGEDA